MNAPKAGLKSSQGPVVKSPLSAVVDRVAWQECTALLAYESPADSPLGHLLSSNQRDVVADCVNGAVLATALASGEELPPVSLEQLMKQLTLTEAEKRAAGGGQGEVFRLQRVVQGGKEGGW